MIHTEKDSDMDKQLAYKNVFLWLVQVADDCAYPIFLGRVEQMLLEGGKRFGHVNVVSYRI